MKSLLVRDPLNSTKEIQVQEVSRLCRDRSGLTSLYLPLRSGFRLHTEYTGGPNPTEFTARARTFSLTMFVNCGCGSSPWDRSIFIRQDVSAVRLRLVAVRRLWLTNPGLTLGFDCQRWGF